MRRPIYLDYNATTPVDPVVLDAMLPYFTEEFGNAASRAHAYGWAADEAVTKSREQVAALLGASPEEVLFTAGATESLNLALKGVAAAHAGRGRHIVTTQIEHSAVLDACRALERSGFRVTYVPPHPDGGVRADDVEAALSDETILVAVMWANNETGVVQPVEEIGLRVRPRGILFLTDATQAVGKVAVRVDHADLLACSAHKFYGPKGVGALFVRQRPKVRLIPLLDGGGHEGGLRGGTTNVPGIVGMGRAAEMAGSMLDAESRRLSGLRDRLERALRGAAEGLRINGSVQPRLPQTSSIILPGMRAANLMADVRELALSAGSACSSGTGRPSHVLKALGLSDSEALSTIRISLGRFTTEEDVALAEASLSAALRRSHAAVTV
jgi:cysteine desulfurase